MKFEDIKKLHQKKFREELGHFVVEGEHLVQELEKAAVHDARLRQSEIYVTRDFAHWSSKLPMHVVQSRQMAQISETRSPQGIAAVVPLLTTPASDVTPEYLRIDPTFKPLFGNARFDRMAKRVAP